MSSCALCWVQEVNNFFYSFFVLCLELSLLLSQKSDNANSFFCPINICQFWRKKLCFWNVGLCETEKLLFFENSLNFFDAFRCVGHRNVLFSSLIIKKPKPKNVALLWVFVPTGHYFFPKKEVVAFDNSLVRFFFLPSCEEY